MNRALVTAIARPADLPLRGATAGRVRAWAAAWWREAVPFAGVAALALTLRLADISVRPLHHDESEHAWFAWRLVTGHGYQYNPIFHGPVQFYLISLMYTLFGITDAVVRVAPVLMGTIVVFLPFFLRRQLGRGAALVCSVLLCLSPSFLYFSRFAREDIYVLCVTFGIVVVLIRFLAEPRRWHPAAFLGLLAVSFATKETTYITVFILGLFLAGAIGVQTLRARRAGRGWLDGEIVHGAVSLGRDAWLWGVSVFLVVYTLLFSTFFTNPGGLKEGIVGSIRYWLSQQPVNRGGSPWFYYLILMPAYEWPILLLGLAGVVVALRRPTTIRLFLVWMAFASIVVFSWASERMPWLIIHPLLPLALLAGIGAQSLWAVRRRLPAKAALGVIGVLGLASVYFAVEASYLRAADPRELLVQVQTANDVPVIRDELMRLEAYSQRTTGHPLGVQVDSWGGTGWPWSWYLRDVPVNFYDMSGPLAFPPAQAVLVADPNHATMAPKLKGYVAHKFHLRVWWVPDWGAAGSRDWLRWVVHRTAWSPTATMDEWLYLKPSLARVAARN